MERTYSVGQVPAIAAEMLAKVEVGTAATIIGLTGELGAGKTTLVQSVAQILGVAETLSSPTFVIAKFYQTTDPRWQTLVHVDAYRIESEAELAVLGWETIVGDPCNLVIVEWPERIATALPPTMSAYMIEHHGTSRHISSL